MIIWSLFDSETNCVAHTFPEHEVYGFGVGGGTEHINLDLSDFDAAKKELDKYPKPDVIFASPPCDSWSRVSVGTLKKYGLKGINLHWEKKWKPIDVKPKYKKTRINGIKTLLTTANIIANYKPAYWAIENGRTSYIFDYIEFYSIIKGKKNFCNYYSYGFDYLKRTTILSNKELCLKNENPGKAKTSIKKMRYVTPRKPYVTKELVLHPKDRSKVPPLLYKDILRQFMHGGQPTMFPLEETA